MFKINWCRVRLKYWILPFFLVLSIMMFASCAKNESKPTPLRGLLRAAKVTHKDFQRTVTAYGYTKATRKADIIAYTQGRIERVWVKNGDGVKKGERLLSIKGYYGIKAMESSGGSYKKGLGKLNPVKNNILKTSPISGYVTSLTKNIGNAVKSGELLLSIVNLENLLAEVEVFGVQASPIKRGQLAIISSDKRQFSGKVSFVSTEISPKTGGRKVGIEISKKGSAKVLPGDFVKAEITIEKHLSSLAIPEEALLSERSQKVVMVKVGQNYEKRVIATGLYSQGYVEVLDGLSGGEEVATTGAYELLNRGIKKKLKVED
ncbi:MAG: efflux RND transporter periplasmic adaptor subunit [bacterium]